MKILGIEVRRAVAPVEQRSSTPATVVSGDGAEFMAFFGLTDAELPRVTIANALTVPAVLAAVTFLSRTLAALPLHAYQRSGAAGAERAVGRLQDVIHRSPNPEMGAYKFRQWFWQQVFTGGRALVWIESSAGEVVNLWPMDPRKVSIKRVAGRTVYRYGQKEYSAEEVIDLPFMLKEDQLGHYGPITQCGKAIQLALALNTYASKFFAGGGVPPLALTGPLAANEGLRRSVDDVDRAIRFARQNGKPIFPIPPGYELRPVGIDPEKGQMTDARLFQIQEIARVYQLPPVFVQDLSRGTFANTEQQDLHLVKHLVGQWSEAFEDELNLKLFGREERDGRYVEHSLDGLMRGDFKSRTEAIARAIQTAQMTPNEARALDNRPKHTNPAADDLLVQGATVPLGTLPAPQATTEPAPTDDGDKTP